MISDTAFDKLLAIYERDRILWAAVYAVSELNTVWSRMAFAPSSMRLTERALMNLCAIHHIDPDA